MSDRAKRIEISNRKFEIQKMDALESLAILKELITRAMPINLIGMFGDEINKLIGTSQFGGIANMAEAKKDMSIDEFIAIQRRILRYTYEILPSGKVQIMNNHGDYCVEDLDQNLALVLEILFESIRFNYESFFIDLLLRVGYIQKTTSEQPLPESL